MMTCTYHQPTNKDLSPTQSVGSLILRPRSTPIRRATISAGSPSKQQPYMNVSEIWTSSLYDTARSTESNNSDGTSKHSSASSTMHSNDSGCATMYSSGDHFLPVTKSPSSQYINMHLEVHPDTGKGYTLPCDRPYLLTDDLLMNNYFMATFQRVVENPQYMNLGLVPPIGRVTAVEL